MEGLKSNGLLVLSVLVFVGKINLAHGVEVVRAPSIESLMKPALWNKVLQEKDILVHASLDSLPQQAARKYSFYAAMRVGRSLRRTHDILTDYRLYSKMIHYIDRAEYFEKDKRLIIEGGIWKFKLKSEIQFQEKSPGWIHYEIIKGHFTGLEGNIYFESLGEKGSVVYMAGEQIGINWPPAFVIERGAEIVFGFTAQRMRTYIETHSDTEIKEDQGALHDSKKGSGVPEPRRHL
jgi:hypothetical protein